MVSILTKRSLNLFWIWSRYHILSIFNFLISLGSKSRLCSNSKGFNPKYWVLNLLRRLTRASCLKNQISLFPVDYETLAYFWTNFESTNADLIENKSSFENCWWTSCVGIVNKSSIFRLAKMAVCLETASWGVFNKFGINNFNTCPVWEIWLCSTHLRSLIL